MLATELDALLATRQDGNGISLALYDTDALYAKDLEEVWSDWLFAGFEFEIGEPGDFLTLAVDATSIIVIRGDDGAVRAFHNVCRHRGTTLCRTERGHVRAIICPYHSWTYSRRGDLVNCHGTVEGIER